MANSVEEKIKENPRLILTAFAGLVIYFLKKKYGAEIFSPEVEAWSNVILPAVFMFAIGWFSRIPKSIRLFLEACKSKKKVDKEDLDSRNQIDACND